MFLTIMAWTGTVLLFLSGLACVFWGFTPEGFLEEQNKYVVGGIKILIGFFIMGFAVWIVTNLASSDEINHNKCGAGTSYTQYSYVVDGNTYYDYTCELPR